MVKESAETDDNWVKAEEYLSRATAGAQGLTKIFLKTPKALVSGVDTVTECELDGCLGTSGPEIAAQANTTKFTRYLPWLLQSTLT